MSDEQKHAKIAIRMQGEAESLKKLAKLLGLKFYEDNLGYTGRVYFNVTPDNERINSLCEMLQIMDAVDGATDNRMKEERTQSRIKRATSEQGKTKKIKM